MTFKVFANGETIGMTELESGDPPMGVAFGTLMPNGTYLKYKALFVHQDYQAIGKLSLFVEAETGERLEPCSGVGIIDYEEEADETFIQVQVLGLDATIYQKYFHHHIRAYDEQL